MIHDSMNGMMMIIVMMMMMMMMMMTMMIMMRQGEWLDYTHHDRDTNEDDYCDDGSKDLAYGSSVYYMLILKHVGERNPKRVSVG